MTAFEPPDFTYFSGLQFNPEIYENDLTETVTLPPSPTFTSVSTPILYTNSIQRLTASIINLFNSPIVTAIYLGGFSTFVYFGNLAVIAGTIAGNGAVSEIGFGDGTTDVVVNGLVLYLIADTMIQLQTPILNILTPSIFLKSTSASDVVNLNFNSSFSNSSVIASSIVATGGSATALQGTLTANANIVRLNTPACRCISTTSSLFTFAFFTSTTSTSTRSASILVSGGNASTDQGTMAINAKNIDMGDAGGTIDLTTGTMTTTVGTFDLQSSDIFMGAATGLIDLTTGTLTAIANIINLNSSSIFIGLAGGAVDIISNLVSIGVIGSTVSLIGGIINIGSSSTINIGDATAIINVEGQMSIANTADIRVAAPSAGTFPIYTNAPTIGITSATGAGTPITAPAWNGIQKDSIYYFAAACTGLFFYVLPTTYRIGNRCRVMNLGTGNVTVIVNGGAARLFGVGCLRTGSTQFVITPLQGCSIECVDGTGIVGGGGNCYFIGAF